jgi:DNA polymerase III delta prime subunit
LKKNEIDTQSLFHLQDTGEALKIDEVKRFLSQGSVRPRFAFQVFFIENISRMTLQAQNACLKFFEEP